MRKIFVSAIIAVLFAAGTAPAEVEQDLEIHNVIGGLYAIAGAAKLHGNNSNITQLARYFAEVPDGWQEKVKLSRVNDSLWAGISVGKYSTARRYLRANAQKLGICESPESYAWLGGDFAWIDVSHLALKAARGSGQDSGLVFLSPDGESWWVAVPSFSKRAEGEIMKTFGVKNAPELHRPAGVSRSLYESVKPSGVRKPEDMHVGRKRTSLDMEVEIGKDLIFDPIPNRPRH